MKRMLSIQGLLPYLLVVFLNAFVDLGHKIIIQNTVFKVYDGQEQIVLTAIVNALILLPFIMLFSPAGFLSDRYRKTRVMQLSAMAAVVIAVAITLSYYAGWFWVAFSLTFLLAIQSAFYSPAKYGFIRELVGDEKISQANAIVQALTIIAILMGTFVFSGVFEYLLHDLEITSESFVLQSVASVGWLLIGFTLIELWAAYRLPDISPGDSTKEFSVVPYMTGHYLRRNFKVIFEKRTIWLSIVGLSMFWAVCQVMLAAFPAFAKEVLQETNTLVIQGILASAGIGIMLGSLVAGRSSKNYIETGLIPVGAIGISVVLWFIPGLDSHITLTLAYFLLGFFGGMFIVPLNSLIQYHASEHSLGTVLAGNNWVQNLAMLSFLLLTAFASSYGVDSKGLFFTLAVVSVIAAIYTVRQLPHSLTRIIATALIRRAYKVRVVGFDNLPKEGGVLLLGNHISWIDWAIVQIACPRPVRFVMLRSIYQLWYLKPIFDLFGVIPIASGSSKESLVLVNERLRAGEVVCLFPEGAISKTGQLGVFHAGYERTVEGVDGFIVPFYLRGLWGSGFSKSYSAKLRQSAGRKREIIVAFGAVLPIETKVDVVKQAVFHASYDAWEAYGDNFQSLPQAWLESAKAKLSAVAVRDTSAEPLTNRKMIAAVLAFSAKLDVLDKQQNMGVLLPASSAALIVNMGLLLKGRTVVNVNYTTSVQAVTGGLSNADVHTVVSSHRFLKKLSARGIDVDAMLQGVTVVYMEDIHAGLSKSTMLAKLVLTSILPAGLLFALFGKRVSIEAPAAILFSSGSEGVPKGIVLSHRNFMANIKQVSEMLNTRDDDVVLGSLPPFHSFGLTVTTFMPLIEGVPVVCHPDPTDALGLAKAISKNDVTLLCATATFLRLYNRNRKVNALMLDSLRVVVAGAERLAPEIREAFKLKFNKDIYEGYGATETTPVVSVNIPDKLDVTTWKPQIGNKPGTVGLPLPGCSFRIVDPASLQELPVNEDGLILISGLQVMLGYLNDAEKTAEAIVEIDGRRWYKTGDKGHVDSDGFLTIVDRYSRFAKLGGEMISLGAVEQVIADVLPDPESEIIAVNVPDEKKGERVVLLYTTDMDTDDLRRRLLDAGANPLMIPSDYLQVDEIPKLGSGKQDFKGAKNIALEMLEG